jgi:hypothetical protein
MAGLHQSTVCSMETGRLLPYPSQLEKVAQALGWTREPRELLEEAGSEPRDS